MDFTSDKKDQLEAMIREFDEDAISPIRIDRTTAFSEVGSGNITLFRVFEFPPKVCVLGNSMDVTGWAKTGANGQSIFRLSQFVCDLNEFSYPIHVVATPFESSPRFLTVRHALVDGGKDVEITAFAWDTNGNAASEVRFNWRCRVVFVRSIQR